MGGRQSQFFKCVYSLIRLFNAENRTVTGGEELLISKGIELINLNSEKCYALMQKFIKEVCKNNDLKY